MFNLRTKTIALTLIATSLSLINAQEIIRYSASAETNFGSGDFTPYYMVSNKHGINSINSNSGYIRAGIFKEIDQEKIFSWSAGVDMLACYNDARNARIHQLYGDINLYCLGLSVGMKEYNGVFKNQNLSSGSMVWSGNSAPIPQLRVGIPEFVSIPGINGWLQIKGDISFGKFIDNDFLSDNFDPINGHITTDAYYHQKQIFFRSKEDKPFVMTIGAELASQFAGHYKLYKDGNVVLDEKNKVNFKSLKKVLIPSEGDADDNPNDQVYFYGNHLGAWHAIGEYKFNNGSRLKGYFEWYFDDASGMGKMNGFDGLWGLEYNIAGQGFLTDVVFEYLQTTNQSGPIHWASGDHNGTSVNGEATGSDDYYNNYYYNGWASNGMALGTPMLRSTGYNKNGYLGFLHTRVKAYHLGANGYITPELKYTALASYRQSWGTHFIPTTKVIDNVSYMIELNYSPTK